MGNAPTHGHHSPSMGHHNPSDLSHVTFNQDTRPHVITGEHVHTFKPTEEELRKLQHQFRSLKVSHGGTVAERLDREAFHHNFAKKLKPQFIDKIFNALDWDHSGVVSFREFVMLTHILFAGTDDEKIDYLFVLYDTNGDGYLAGEEIGRLAHGCAAAMRSLLRTLEPEGKQAHLPASAAEKALAEKKLAQTILDEADQDRDGKLSADEFKAYCKKHPEALQELKQLADLLRHVLGEELRAKPAASPKMPRPDAPAAAEPAKAHSPKIPHALEAGIVPTAPVAVAAGGRSASSSGLGGSPHKSPKIPLAAPPPDLLGHADFALEQEAHKLTHHTGSLDKLAS